LHFLTKKKKTMKKSGFILILAVAALFFQSCQKEGQGDAPKLPSDKTFVMPLEEIKEGLAGEQIEDRSFSNFGHSVANVVVWNTLLTIHLAVPVAAFHAAINQQPIPQGGGVWLWRYNVNHDGAIYKARLYGELLPATEEVKWDMYISKTGFGGFNDVHWYSGITAWDESYATWTLNHNPYAPAPLIDIAYQRDNGAGVASIRYTNAITGDAGNGSYIEYREGLYNGGEFDRAYDVFKIDIDNLLEINWNSIDKYGRVKDFEKFGDEEWHCWGMDLKDTDC
jgi:hypothetical protein